MKCNLSGDKSLIVLCNFSLIVIIVVAFCPELPEIQLVTITYRFNSPEFPDSSHTRLLQRTNT